MSGVPLRYVAPWPTQWLGPLPDAEILDRVLVSNLDASLADDQIAVACNVYIVGGIDLVSIPGFAGIVVGANTDGIDIDLRVGETAGAVTFRLAVTSVDISLFIAASLLRPVLPGTNTPDPQATRTIIQIGTIALSIDASGQFVFGATPAITLPRCMLGTTGVIVEADDVVPRFSGEQALPPAAAGLGLPDDWRGVFVGRARVTLPNGLAGILPSDLTLSDAVIGNHGFSGSIDVDWTPPFAASLFGITLAMNHIGIAIDDNVLTNVDLRGALTLPALTAPDGSPAPLAFTIVAGTAGYRIVVGNIPPLKLGGVALDLDAVALGFDANAITEVDLRGEVRIPGLTDDTGGVAKVAFDVGYTNGLFTLQAAATPTLRLGPFGIRIDHFDLSFDHTGPRSTALAATLKIPGLKNADGTPASIAVQISVAADRFAAAVGALPPLKLGSLVLEFDAFALAFGGGAPLDAAISGRLSIPNAKDAAGNPVAIAFDLEVEDDLFRIATTNLPAFAIAGVQIQLTAFAIGFDENGVVGAETTIAGTVRIPAFKDSAGNPIAIGVTVDLTDGFDVTAVLPGGELEVLAIANTLRIVLRELGFGVGAAGVRFRIGGRIESELALPLVGDLLPSVVDVHELAFRAPDDLSLDVGVAWRNGMRAGSDGQGGFAVDIPVGEIALGFSVDAVGLRLRKLGAAYEVSIVFRGASLELGPVLGIVDGMGLAATITPATGGGNLGPLDLAMRLVPPTGIGLLLDTPTVRVGGFLSIDTERGRYVGAVELALFKKLEINAICIITTKLPDGSEGFTLLVVIGVTFPVPIPLGYNFYLTGVGGILGIQRGFDTDRLRDGLQSGILDRVLFPRNILSNIDRVVSDLDAVFPIAPGAFLIGPTITIEWSQPALVTAKLAIILSFDKSFKAAIAGVIRVALPTPDEPVLQLQAGFLGTLDFEVGMLSFDASIYDSFFGVGGFKITVEGDIALRISWGKQKDFVISVGGFHPAFKVPEHLRLPAMKRVTLSVMRDNPRLSLSAYFAITTNTVQLGARAELYVQVGPVEIVGTLGFDALFQFNPFRFMLSLEILVSVRLLGADVLAVGVQLQLEGPTPWYAKGVAFVKVLFFEARVEFETRFGEVLEQPRETIALLPLLRAELDKPASWSVIDTASTSTLVTRRPLAPNQASDAFVLETAGRLAVRQAVLPLARTLASFGPQDPSDVARFDVERLEIAGSGTTLVPTTEPFAPAMFTRMSDRDKLAAPAYEVMQAGIEAAIAGDGFTTGARVRKRQYTYERAVSDHGPAVALPAAQGTAEELDRLLAGSSAARSGAAKARRHAQVGEDLTVAEERFAIVTMANKVVADGLPRSEAVALVDELVATGGLAFALTGATLVVAAVAPGSPAALAAIAPGDIVVTIDGRSVANLHEARLLAAGAGGRGVTYVLRTNGVQRTAGVAGTRDPSSLIVLPTGLLAA